MNADEKKSCTIRVHELRLRFRVCVRIGRAHTRREREKMNLNEKKNQQQLKKNRTKLGFGGREMLIWKINADVEIVRRFRRAPAQAARIRISMHMNCEKKFKVSTQFSRQQLRRLWRVGRKRERERAFSWHARCERLYCCCYRCHEWCHRPGENSPSHSLTHCVPFLLAF